VPTVPHDRDNATKRKGKAAGFTVDMTDLIGRVSIVVTIVSLRHARLRL